MMDGEENSFCSPLITRLSLWHHIGNFADKIFYMQTEDNNQSQKDKRTDFFEKREMNMDITDADNQGTNAFTPIYLDDENVLQTPEEKQHDDSVDAQKNDKLEAIDIDAEKTTFDKMNDEERNGIGE